MKYVLQEYMGEKIKKVSKFEDRILTTEVDKLISWLEIPKQHKKLLNYNTWNLFILCLFPILSILKDSKILYKFWQQTD